MVYGLFGVFKGDVTSLDFDSDATILRLTVSLVLPNELQNVVEGEIGSPPVFTQWALLELLGREYLMLSAMDTRAASYLVGLPRERWPYFVLSVRISGELAAELELNATSRWPCVILDPMGWLSAAGVTQHLHSPLIRLAEPRVPPGPRLLHLSREMIPRAAWDDLRGREFLEAYLDDYLQAENMLEEEECSLEGLRRPTREALLEVYQEWGVPSSQDKAVVQVPGNLR